MTYILNNAVKKTRFFFILVKILLLYQACNISFSRAAEDPGVNNTEEGVNEDLDERKYKIGDVVDKFNRASYNDIQEVILGASAENMPPVNFFDASADDLIAKWPEVEKALSGNRDAISLLMAVLLYDSYKLPQSSGEEGVISLLENKQEIPTQLLSKRLMYWFINTTLSEGLKYVEATSDTLSDSMERRFPDGVFNRFEEPKLIFSDIKAHCTALAGVARKARLGIKSINSKTTFIKPKDKVYTQVLSALQALDLNYLKNGEQMPYGVPLIPLVKKGVNNSFPECEELFATLSLLYQLDENLKKGSTQKTIIDGKIPDINLMHRDSINLESKEDAQFYHYLVLKHIVHPLAFESNAGLSKRLCSRSLQSNVSMGLAAFRQTASLSTELKISSDIDASTFEYWRQIPSLFAKMMLINDIKSLFIIANNYEDLKKDCKDHISKVFATEIELMPSQIDKIKGDADALKTFKESNTQGFSALLVEGKGYVSSAISSCLDGAFNNVMKNQFEEKVSRISLDKDQYDVTKILQEVEESQGHSMSDNTLSNRWISTIRYLKSKITSMMPILNARLKARIASIELREKSATLNGLSKIISRKISSLNTSMCDFMSQVDSCLLDCKQSLDSYGNFYNSGDEVIFDNQSLDSLTIPQNLSDYIFNMVLGKDHIESLLWTFKPDKSNPKDYRNADFPLIHYSYQVQKTDTGENLSGFKLKLSDRKTNVSARNIRGIVDWESTLQEEEPSYGLTLQQDNKKKKDDQQLGVNIKFISKKSIGKKVRFTPYKKVKNVKSSGILKEDMKICYDIGLHPFHDIVVNVMQSLETAVMESAVQSADSMFKSFIGAMGQPQVRILVSFAVTKQKVKKNKLMSVFTASQQEDYNKSILTEYNKFLLNDQKQNVSTGSEELLYTVRFGDLVIAITMGSMKNTLDTFVNVTPEDFDKERFQVLDVDSIFGKSVCGMIAETCTGSRDYSKLNTRVFGARISLLTAATNPVYSPVLSSYALMSNSKDPAYIDELQQETPGVQSVIQKILANACEVEDIFPFIKGYDDLRYILLATASQNHSIFAPKLDNINTKTYCISSFYPVKSGGDKEVFELLNQIQTGKDTSGFKAAGLRIRNVLNNPQRASSSVGRILLFIAAIYTTYCLGRWWINREPYDVRRLRMISAYILLGVICLLVINKLIISSQGSSQYRY